MNTAQVDKDGAELAAVIEREVASEGIAPASGVLSIGQVARIRTIAAEIAGQDWTFRPYVDVARSNRVAVTAMAFHGKVEA